MINQIHWENKSLTLNEFLNILNIIISKYFQKKQNKIYKIQLTDSIEHTYNGDSMDIMMILIIFDKLFKLNCPEDNISDIINIRIENIETVFDIATYLSKCLFNLEKKLNKSININITHLDDIFQEIKIKKKSLF